MLKSKLRNSKEVKFIRNSLEPKKEIYTIPPKVGQGPSERREFVLDYPSSSEPELLNWLDYIPNLSSEEKRTKMTPKNYRKVLKESRRLNREYSYSLHFIISSPDLFNEKLAELAACVPTSGEFKVKGIQYLLGKGQYTKIRSVLLFLEFSLDEEWLRFLLMEPFLRLIPSKSTSPGIQAELKFLGMILQMNKIQRRELLLKIFSSHNLEKMIEKGKELTSRMTISLFETAPVAQLSRKRGYNDKGSTSLTPNKERRRIMNEGERSFSEIKEDILRKQLLLFERNLDRLLQISESEDRQQIKRIISDQEEDLEILNEEQLERENQFRKDH